MRQSHAAGEKVFVAFAGDTIDAVDPSTGEVRPMKLFVAAMGASSYIFAPKFVVCDNLKAAATNPDRYEPGLNRSYLEFADHYGAAILPARPYKPRDKAKVVQSQGPRCRLCSTRTPSARPPNSAGKCRSVARSGCSTGWFRSARFAN